MKIIDVYKYFISYNRDHGLRKSSIYFFRLVLNHVKSALKKTELIFFETSIHDDFNVHMEDSLNLKKIGREYIEKL